MFQVDAYSEVLSCETNISANCGTEMRYYVQNFVFSNYPMSRCGGVTFLLSVSVPLSETSNPVRVLLNGRLVVHACYLLLKGSADVGPSAFQSGREKAVGNTEDLRM